MLHPPQMMISKGYCFARKRQSHMESWHDSFIEMWWMSFSQKNLLSCRRLFWCRLQLEMNMHETWQMKCINSKSWRWSVVVPLLVWLIVQIFEWCLGVVSRLVLVHFRSTIYYSWGVVTRLLCRRAFFIFVALNIIWETPLTIIQKLSQELDSMMFSSDWIFWWLGLG